MPSLIQGRLLIEREASVDFRRYATRYELKDFTAKLDEESVKAIVNLLFLVTSLLLGIFEGNVNELQYTDTSNYQSLQKHKLRSVCKE